MFFPTSILDLLSFNRINKSGDKYFYLPFWEKSYNEFFYIFEKSDGEKLLLVISPLKTIFQQAFAFLCGILILPWILFTGRGVGGNWLWKMLGDNGQKIEVSLQGWSIGLSPFIILMLSIVLNFILHNKIRQFLEKRYKVKNPLTLFQWLRNEAETKITFDLIVSFAVRFLICFFFIVWTFLLIVRAHGLISISILSKIVFTVAMFLCFGWGLLVQVIFLFFKLTNNKN